MLDREAFDLRVTLSYSYRGTPKTKTTTYTIMHPIDVVYLSERYTVGKDFFFIVTLEGNIGEIASISLDDAQVLNPRDTTYNYIVKQGLQSSRFMGFTSDILSGELYFSGSWEGKLRASVNNSSDGVIAYKSQDFAFGSANDRWCTTDIVYKSDFRDQMRMEISMYTNTISPTSVGGTRISNGFTADSYSASGYNDTLLSFTTTIIVPPAGQWQYSIPNTYLDDSVYGECILARYEIGWG